MKTFNIMKLFITTYEAYNNGTQFEKGAWYELDNYSDLDELQEVLNEVYSSDSEFMITDFEGFPSEWYEESFRPENVETLIKIANNDEIDADDLDFSNLSHEYSEEYVGENDEQYISELLGSHDTWSILCRGHSGDWNPSHKYVTLDGYANLKSSDNIEDLIDTSSIICKIYEAHK